MSPENIGYNPNTIARMPEVRSNIIEAKFAPRLNTADRRLASLTDSQLEFFAQVLS
ncbi:MAG TPA: hypothetical protein VN174_03125 [Candidatus Methanoperedens sp.]|nr:hypothetical protein [Candidatus Methanoperedens sp.]